MNNVRKHFDAQHCGLERNPEKLQRYVQMLEEALGDQAKVVGVLEIGSHAKGEAVYCSDIDTRVYVISPKVYLWNMFFGDPQPLEQDPQCRSFMKEYGSLPRQDHSWSEFNEPVSQRISEALSMEIEFCLVDQRYVEFELRNLDRNPSREHSYLLQSNILHDPDGFLKQKCKELKGRVYPSLVKLYREQFLDQVPPSIYRFLEPHSSDEYKIGKGGQIQWVQRAVRCLRDAAASRTYISTGEFVYKKNDVIAFYGHYLPDDLTFVQRMYDWKTNPQTREHMVREFIRERDRFYQLFRGLMPQLEAIVGRVRNLEL